ncbi:MAG: dipeptidyl-peptidase 7 [Ignavibacteriae bacterium]|nr:MAG: dipeptidyl-peptidase 7 [Ignavibacteriota bacterium]
MFKFSKIFFSIVFILFLGMKLSAPQEGMYPLSEIHKIDLVKAGLKINPSDVYNPNGISLIDALVNIGGCTGSFVSDKGLILTNHHCAFRAINRASTQENNYLENGFLANNQSEEIPAEGTTVKITESYEDVSEKILSVVKGINDLSEKAKLIKDKMKELEEEATDKKNSIEAEISEMFKGKTYVLFKYRIIKDVRLVYAPPRSIGEFGGETDNWIWPRHTGDFTFMRAYVAPDGSAAEYSKNNIPYTPKKFLQVNPKGVEEGDFVFILGYPARTYRHLPSFFLKYQEEYNLPYISKIYDWMIKKAESIGETNDKFKLKYASYIKSLANVKKNYTGKLKGLRRINLVEQKENEEKEINDFILNNKELKEKYASLFSEFDSTYKDMYEIADQYLWFKALNRVSISKRIANMIIEYCEEIQKPSEERTKYYKEENIAKTKERLFRYVELYDFNFESSLLKKMFTDAKKLNINYLKNEIPNEAIEEFVNELLSNSKIFDKKVVEEILLECPDELNYPFLNFAKKLKKENDLLNDKYDEINNRITNLSAKLYEVKKEWKKTDFIPDANSTLRLTYGYIKGYSPADAVYMNPITTLDGVIDKSYLGGDYAIPDKLKTLYDKKDFGKFYNEKLKSVPVAILYNMDTTGGNSGSPIMNAYGEMIGINFDRAYEATINDFAWNDDYSRSIGVDIRYVLWLTEKFGGAGYLLKEMRIN